MENGGMRISPAKQHRPSHQAVYDQGNIPETPHEASGYPALQKPRPSCKPSSQRSARTNDS